MITPYENIPLGPLTRPRIDSKKIILICDLNVDFLNIRRSNSVNDILTGERERERHVHSILF